MPDIEAESFPSIVREREGFNDMVTNRRLKVLAEKIAPEPQLPGVPAGELALLVDIVKRLTFGEMMTLAEGILGNPPPAEPLKPFDLATRLWNFAGAWE